MALCYSSTTCAIKVTNVIMRKLIVSGTFTLKAALCFPRKYIHKSLAAVVENVENFTVMQVGKHIKTVLTQLFTCFGSNGNLKGNSN